MFYFVTPFFSAKIQSVEGYLNPHSGNVNPCEKNVNPG